MTTRTSSLVGGRSSAVAVAMVAVAALVVVAGPVLVGRLWDASTLTYLRVAVVLLALFPGTVAWIARGARQPGVVIAAAVLAPFPILMIVMEPLGSLILGAISAVGIGLAITMALAASRSGRLRTPFGFVFGAIGIGLFVVGPQLILNIGLRL